MSTEHITVYWVVQYTNGKLEHMLDGPFATKELAQNRSDDFTSDSIQGSCVVSQQINVEYVNE